MDKKVVTDFIRKQISGSEIFLVDVLLKPGNIIHVYLDKPQGITIDECVQISRDFNAHFDREKEDYDLQVSSPGLDMPLRVKEQFAKYLNRQVRVIGEDGSKTTGVLKEFNEDQITLLEERKIKQEGSKKKRTETVETTFNFNNIKAVKAIISFK